MMKPIYLDYNATTPIDPEVAKAMIPFLFEHFGNPSSSHVFGNQARETIDEARSKVGKLLNCKAKNIIFTSGGTESNNIAIRGAAFANKHRGNHIITSAIEHPAVIEVCKWLALQGFELTILPVDQYGLVNPSDLERNIKSQTILVTIMHANNEVGTIQPIRQLSEITHRYNAIFHTDAAQTIGKIPVDVTRLGVDLLSIAGHKFYAPKGVGALYIDDNIQLEKLMFGANHENGLRPGTENTLEIVGLGEACQIAKRDIDKLQSEFWDFRNMLYEGLKTTLGSESIRLNGHPTMCLPNTLNISIRNLTATDLLSLLSNHVAASAGSACHSDQVNISSVLEAMEVPIEWAIGTVRFSVGRGTSKDQIQQAIKFIADAINNLHDRKFTLGALG
ncbi:cysteine desulfurase [bacterium SM23_57]|jgi:cysteine desulfurase|nr:MAG: cysteine desulfurase [bacterium SM23_57]